MANDFVVGIRVHGDASQLKAEFVGAAQASHQLREALTTSSAGASAGLESVSASAGQMGTAVLSAAGQAQAGLSATQAATQAVGGAIQASAAQGSQGLDNLTRASKGLEAQQQVTRAGQVSAAQAGEAYARAVDVGAQANSKGAISAAQHAAAMRMLPAQITDVTTSLASGMPIWLVAIQQGGQIKDSFGGIGNTARALIGAITPATAAIAGTAAVLGVLGAAYYQGSSEGDEFRRAIVMTGNAAGVTEGQLSDMARAVSEVIGTQGSAAAVLAEMAGSGRIAGENLTYFTQVALGLEQYVGVPVKNTVKDLDELGKKPLEASLKLNEQYRYLTVAVYEQIRALERQGKDEEAASVAQKAYAEAFEKRSNVMREKLGYLQRGWMEVGKAASWAWDKILGIGRETTDQQRLDQLRQNLERAEERNARPGFKEGKATQQLREEIRLLEQKIAGKAAEAKAEADEPKKAGAIAEWQKVKLSNLSKEKKLLDEIAQIRIKGAAAGAKEAEIEAEVAAHKAKSAGKSGTSAARDALDAQIEQTRQGYKRLQAETADGLDAIDALRQQGVLSEYDAVQRSAALRLADIDGQKEALKAELQLLKGRKDSAKEQTAVEGQLVALEQRRINLQNASARDLQTLLIRPQQELVKTLRQSTASIYDQATAIEAQNRVFGMGELAIIDLNLAQLEKRRLDLEATDNVIPGYIAALEDQIAATKRLRDAVSQKATLEWSKGVADESQKAQERMVEAAERGNEQIAQSLTDNLMRAGKSGAEYIEDLFRTMVLRPALMAVVSPVAGAVNSVIGGATSGLMSGLGLAGNATSLASSLTGGSGLLGSLGSLGSIGASLSTFGTAAGYGASALFAGNGLGALGGAANMIGAGSFASGFGMAAGVLGPIALGVAALPTVIGSLFGRKLKDSGIEGNFGGDRGFEGQTFSYYKGGLFRSNKTKYGDLDEDLRRSLGDQYNAVRASAKGMAGALGLGTQAIDGFSAHIKVSLKDLSAEEVQKRLSEEFERVAESLAAATLGTQEYTRTGETSMQTLTRLSSSLSAVNSSFETLGVSLYSTSLAGGDMASNLVDRFGGLDGFNSATGAYFATYYSAQEQREAAQRQLRRQLAEFDLALPDVDATDALAQWRELVTAQDRATEAGQRNWAMLVQLAPAYAEVVRAGQDAAKAAAAETAAAEAAEAAARDAAEAAAAEAARKLAETSSRQADIQIQLLRAQGNELAAVAMERQRELVALQQYGAGAEALQRVLWGITDAQAAVSSAYSGLERATAAERSRAEAAATAAQSLRNEAQAVFDVLGGGIAQLLGGVGGAVAMQAASARAYISQAAVTAGKTGALPDDQALRDALAAVTNEVNSKAYASQFEADADRQILAGRLTAIQEVSGRQVSAAQRQVDAAEAQVKQLDATLQYWSQQIDLQQQGNAGISSVRDAVLAMGAAFQQQRGASAIGAYHGAIQAASTQTEADKIALYRTLEAAGHSDAAIRAQVTKSVGAQSDSDWDYLQRMAKLPRYDVGTNYVPHDMLALIHEGEMIVPKAFNPLALGSQSGTGAVDSQVAIRVLERIAAMLGQMLAPLRATATATTKHADQFESVSNAGNAIMTEAL